MKVDESKSEFESFMGRLDEYWYQMGYNSYLGVEPSAELNDSLSAIQKLSFRKGVTDAAKRAGELEEQDFHSKVEAKYVDDIFKERMNDLDQEMKSGR